jgi:hypothetical protein
MIGRILLLLLVASSAVLCQNFNSYTSRMNKRYYDDNERFYRSQLYTKKMAELDAINAQGLSYTVGENQFTDRTDA